MKKQGKNHMELLSYYLVIKDETGLDIKAKKRTRNIIDLVKIFCKFIKTKFPHIPLSEIGYFLKRDHASISHAINGYDDLHLTDKDFKAKAEHFKELFYAMDSLNPPEEYKQKLIDIIEVSPESVRKDIYEQLKEQEAIKRNIEKIIHD